MNRRQREQDLLLSFSRAAIGRSMGMTLRFENSGEAVFDMPYNPDFTHALGDTHGGVIATLIDNAGWFAAALHYPGWIATSEMQIRLLEPARREPLQATGKVIRKGKTFAVTQMEVKSATGRLVAVGSGAYVASTRSLPIQPGASQEDPALKSTASDE